ncbi:hypothetical protein [Streptomyces filamentosus]|uniref:hypothetical protein n=1 Tax=Streptomyces filamentosus TaxID=67294 RepID=UPI0033D62DD2
MTTATATTYELRLIDPNGYTAIAEGAVRREVPAHEIEAVTAELKALAEKDAENQRTHYLGASRIFAPDYRIQTTPPVA